MGGAVTEAIPDLDELRRLREFLDAADGLPWMTYQPDQGAPCPILAEVGTYPVVKDEVGVVLLWENARVLVAAVNALPSLLERISRLEEALREVEFDPSLSSLLNEYQMVNDQWPPGVDPIWRRFCTWRCGGDNIHGHQPGCRIAALLVQSEQPQK
jgi:hypothetical protein